MKTIDSEIDTLLERLTQSDGILNNLDFQTEARDETDRPLLIWAIAAQASYGIASRVSIGITVCSMALGIGLGFAIWGMS